MRNLIILISILLITIAVWFVVKNNKKENPKPQPLAVSKHSSAFNQSIEDAMETYYNLTEAFVNWDSTNAAAKASELKIKLDSLKLDDLKKDSGSISQTALTFIANAKNDVNSIVSETGIENKRHSLNSLTDNLFQFLRVVHYDREKLYLQQCPMAFNDTEPGLWLSKKDSIRNPYLGLHHPRYGKGMIECGETKETLNFTPGK